MKKLTCLLILAVTAGAQAAERAVDVSAVVKAPVADVFKAWTTTQGVTTFLAPGAIVEPRPNGLFEIHMNPLAPPGERGADDMRILGIQENKMVSFTWNAPPSFPEARKQRTTVIVRFTPEGKSHTKVTLHQVGWGEGGEWDKAYDYFSKAWPYVLGNLKDRFEWGPIDWAAHSQRVKAEQGKAR